MAPQANESRPTNSSEDDMTPLCHIVTPVGMMGYGFDEAVVETELRKLSFMSTPTAIILDSGSTDSGPSKLALGGMTAPRSAYKRDLIKLMRLIDTYNVPLLFSSAGGDGSNAHVDEMRVVIEEIVSEQFPHRHFKTVSIYSEVAKTLVLERYNQGLITGCGTAVPALTVDDIDAAPTIVAQMGCEPFLDAMFETPDFDVIIGGRAYDPSPYVAYAAYHAMGPSKRTPFRDLGQKFLGGIFHMGKIMECGALCSIPKSQSSVATIYTSGAFDVAPLAKDAKCTPLSVASHTLYEKSRPDLLYGPGGCLDLSTTTYEQLMDGRSVRSHGAIFRCLPTADQPYTVKLEGARIIGYRSIFMGSFRDPILIRQLDDILEGIKAFVGIQNAGITEHWDLQFHKYGASPNSGLDQETFIVGEALADAQALANGVASLARIAATHAAYPGQKATSGNFAFGIGGKNEFEASPCAEFCIYHLMDLKAGEEGARDVTANLHVSEAAGGKKGVSKLFTYRRDIVGNDSTGHGSTNGTDEKTAKKDQQAVLNMKPATPSAAKKDGFSRPVTAQSGSFTNRIIDSKCETLGDAASVLRSKNAGPYEVTFDVMFDSPALYQVIKNSNLLNTALISNLYAIDEADVIYCGFFDQAMAFKATIPRMKGGRRSASGGFMENDVHGSGQYLPLMKLRLPDGLKESIQALQLKEAART